MVLKLKVINSSHYYMHAWSLDSVQLYVTLWTVALQAPLSMRILPARILEWTAMPSSRESSKPRDQTHVSCIAGRCFTIRATREVSLLVYFSSFTVNLLCGHW